MRPSLQNHNQPGDPGRYPHKTLATTVANPIVIKQGAEAILYVSDFVGVKCLIKERFIKKYRHPDLDKMLTKQRMKAELSAYDRCEKIGILVPKIIHSDYFERKMYMEYFENAITIKSYITNCIINNDSVDKQLELIQRLAENVGKVIGKMHKHGICHGDLTTSNILVNSKRTCSLGLTTITGKPGMDTIVGFDEYDLIMIDFGLSRRQRDLENKAVDLYVLERSLISTHSTVKNLFDLILLQYQEVDSTCANDFLRKYQQVRSRGRKRTAIG